MTPRALALTVHAPDQPMGPLTVRQPLPSAELAHLDPFVLLHHAPPRIADGRAGVAAHPHRGFAPVSFIFTGGVRHRDSRGHDSTILAGGTQWMHAGRGILHEEQPLPGEMELIQLWINSPAARKMDTPTYFPLTAEATPQQLSEDGRIRVNVVSGQLLGIAGPVPSLTPINAATIDARRGGTLSVALPPDHNAFLYLLDGALAFSGGATVTGPRLAVFANDGDGLLFEALADTRALLMSGRPLGEPVVTGGPFVMNSDDEIRQAFRDYRSGAFGQIG